MANQNLGQHRVTLGGAEYTLRYSLDALAELEDLFGKPIAGIMADFQNPEIPNLRMLQKLVHVGLQEFHPEISLQQAGRLGLPAELMGAMTGAMFGKPDDAEIKPANPL